jgi:hypothetical protein
MVWRCWRLATGVGLVGGDFLGSVRGLWVVSCGQFVRVSWRGGRPICPENAGARWKKEETRHCTTQAPPSQPVLLRLRPGRPAVAGSATPTGPFRRWLVACMPFPGDCIPQARNGRGVKETVGGGGPIRGSHPPLLALSRRKVTHCCADKLLQALRTSKLVNQLAMPVGDLVSFSHFLKWGCN